jgi:hypothetical protein
VQQVFELCYPIMRAVNHRLLDLFKWRVLDRFQPFVSSGTAPMHYVLDMPGAVALAYEDGLDPKQLGYRHEDAIGITHSLRLAHTVGVNGFFTTLVALSRPPGARGRLTAWWSELRCDRLFGDMVRPDAYGRWREDGHQIEFFLEFDFGTEDLGKLGRKLHSYEKLATATGITTPVLVWLPTNRRGTTARLYRYCARSDKRVSSARSLRSTSTLVTTRVAIIPMGSSGINGNPGGFMVILQVPTVLDGSSMAVSVD